MIHDKNTQSKIVGELIFVFIPLILFGLYKNGYLLYQKNLISLGEIFKGLYLILISFGIYELGSLIFNHKFCWDYDLFPFFITALIVSPNVNLGIYSLVLAFSFIIFKILGKVNFNHIAFLKLAIMGSMYFFKNYSYLNLLEQNFKYDYSIADQLWGFQVGGIAATSVIIALIIFIYLAVRKNIKKEIALSSIFTYLLLTIIIMVGRGQFNYLLIINANVFFAYLFVATENISSPNTKQGMLIYGIIIGLLTIIFNNYINSYEGPYLAILFASLIAKIGDKKVKKANFNKKLKKK